MDSGIELEINDIGREPSSLEETAEQEGVQSGHDRQSPPGKNDHRISAAKNKKLWWMIGGGISLLPAVVVGLVRFCLFDASFGMILRMLSNTSIMYTGVTLMVSAINDLDFASESQSVRDEANKRLVWYLIILVSCVMFYAIMEFCMNVMAFPVPKRQHAFGTVFLIILNIFFVTVPAVLGWKQYGDDIRRAEGKGDE